MRSGAVKQAPQLARVNKMSLKFPDHKYKCVAGDGFKSIGGGAPPAPKVKKQKVRRRLLELALAVRSLAAPCSLAMLLLLLLSNRRLAICYLSRKRATPAWTQRAAESPLATGTSSSRSSLARSSPL
jgi:hypothetical protein